MPQGSFPIPAAFQSPEFFSSYIFLNKFENYLNPCFFKVILNSRRKSYN